jgi:hypothetical protein
MRIEIDRRRLSSLLKHFDLHPKLGRLIHECRLRQATDSDDSDDLEEEEDDGSVYVELPGLLSNLSNLESIVVEGNLGGSFSPTVEILSELPKLVDTQLFVEDRPQWWSEMFPTLNSGFKRLSSLSFGAPGGVLSEFIVDDIQPHEDRIPLQTLMVGWDAVPAINSQLAERFLSRLDPNTLQVVNLLDSAACITAFKWLPGCPNLVNLGIELSLHQVLQDFPEYLSILPQFPSLKFFEVGVGNTNQIVTSPVPLAAILASFTPSLRTIDCPQFVFTDLDALPRRELPQSPSEATRHLAAMCPDPDGAFGRGLDEATVAVGMIVWGEESEGTIAWSYNAERTEEYLFAG